ncbi:hypothetical protein ACFJGW_04040 [Burkholderiaceae bacterium UC74_6]
MSAVFYFCFLALIIWLMRRMNLRDAQQLEAQRSVARAQFLQWLQSPVATQLHLESVNPNPVHMVEDTPRGRDAGTAHYCLTWFLRNTEGHYVMLMSTQNEKPFVKVLEDRYARAVLKTRYQAPD